jgi:MFS family permease
MNEIRQRWPLIVAAGVGVASSSIALPFYTIGAFLKPLTAEFGWSRADVQSAILFSSGLGALMAPLVAWMNDRYGSRPIALIGLAGLASGFFIASALNGQLWLFYLAYGCMAVLGAGSTPVTWTRAIASTFDQQRGFALGLTLAGTGVCAILAPLLTIRLIAMFGWRGAYAGIGAVPILIAGPIVWFGFRSHADGRRGTLPGVPNAACSVVWEREASTAGLTLSEAVRGYRFWLLCGSILVVYLALSGISPNLIAALTDRGFSAARASTAQAAYGFAIIVGRLAVGFLVDRLWAPGVAVVSLALPAAGCWILSGSTDYGWILAAAFLIGFAAGAELDLMAFLCSRYFGLRHYAKIYAIQYSILATAGGTAPLLFAHLYDRTRSYRLSFLLAAALLLAGGLALPWLGRYPGAAGENKA